VVSIVGCSELEEDEIDCSDGGTDEEDLHRRVVHRDERRQEVQVASQEHQSEQNLGAACKKLLKM
jgi:hypothetical protein